ncbi:hypothetical protein Tco_0705371 [Tanacetum coccineum]|uniref:Uncharacterized protein n=1 Tax=Tanacetum coccineum TaxID=301880 RepID=A0ABQ4Y588_9ASTR
MGGRLSAPDRIALSARVVIEKFCGTTRAEVNSDVNSNMVGAVTDQAHDTIHEGVTINDLLNGECSEEEGTYDDTHNVENIEKSMRPTGGGSDSAKDVFAAAVTPPSPSARPSVVFSSKGDSGSPLEKLQSQVFRLLKGLTPPFNCNRLACNCRLWILKEPSRLFESMVVVGLHPSCDIQALKRQYFGRRPEGPGRLRSALSGQHQFRVEPNLEPQEMYQQLRLEAYDVHTTFQYAGTEGKRHRLREAMVFFDQPEYYDSPDEANKDRPCNSIDLKSYIVYSPLWCRLDRLWFPHPGVLLGLMTRQPFICPLDHVFEVQTMLKALPEEEFGPGISIREYSFFDNPLMPTQEMTGGPIFAGPCFSHVLNDQGWSGLFIWFDDKVIGVSSEFGVQEMLNGTTENVQLSRSSSVTERATDEHHFLKGSPSEDRNFRSDVDSADTEEASFSGQEGNEQNDILDWAKTNNHGSVQIICEYNRLCVPARGSTIKFHPLEHLHPLEFHRPDETVLHMAGSTVDLMSCSTSFEFAEAHRALAVEEATGNFMLMWLLAS